MSKVKIEGNASGTGTFTIAAPNSNTDYSLTLPETTGGEFVVTDSSGRVGIGTSSPSYLLDVNGGTDNIVSRFKSTDAVSLIAFEDSSTTTDNVYVGAVGNDLYGYGSGSVYLQSGGSDSLILDGSSNLKFNSGYGSVATAYGCRAWVNFNGTGTVAINGSGNVSSVSDGGTGIYTVNFATAMPDVNFSGLAGSNLSDIGNILYLRASSTSSGANLNSYGNSGLQDASEINFAVFR